MPKKIKVVMIDDEADLCLLVKSNLEDTGEYDVVTTSKPQEAKKICQKEKPDIIVLDNIMPTVKGSQIVKDLHGDPALKDTPVIMISGKGEMVYTKQKDQFQWRPDNPLARERGKVAEGKDVPQQVMQEALSVEKQLQEALSERERLSQELTLLRQQLTKTPPPQTVVASAQVSPQPSTQVHTIAPHFTRQAGIASLPQYPNIVSGIVKDAHGDILPNIIVEVKDQTDNPVRAFKTNKLGQFSASTSLANGHYTIFLEDPKDTYQFEVIAIELTGSVFQPLEIMAKDVEVAKKQNERQQLHQALFGAKPAPSN